MVGTLELGAIPHRLAIPVGRELAWNFDRLPAHAPADVETLGLAFAKGHPHRLPAAQLADAPGPLWQREEKAVAQMALTWCTNAPSAVAQKMTSRFIASANDVSRPRSMSARMLPPKPAPMMRAPRQPSTPQACSTSASTVGVDTSKSSRRLWCDSLSRTPNRSKRRSLSASTKAWTRATSDSKWRRRFGLPASASRRRSL